MATFAQIDENNIVLQIVKVDDSEVPGGNGDVAGETYCNNLFGGTWKQCSYNTVANVHSLGETPFRKNMADKGGTWDQSRDAFYGPQPYSSWALNETTCVWEAPVAAPSTQDAGGDVFVYGNTWNESDQRWEAVQYDNSDTPTSNKYYWNPSDSSWVAI